MMYQAQTTTRSLADVSRADLTELCLDLLTLVFNCVLGIFLLFY